MVEEGIRCCYHRCHWFGMWITTPLLSLLLKSLPPYHLTPLILHLTSLSDRPPASDCRKQGATAAGLAAWTSEHVTAVTAAGAEIDGTAGAGVEGERERREGGRGGV